jgi:hypothetical protein
MRQLHRLNLERHIFLSIHLALELLAHGAASEDFQTALSCKNKTPIKSDLQNEVLLKISIKFIIDGVH